MDETLVGGKKKGKGRAYKGNKQWVAGAIKRGGKVRIDAALRNIGIRFSEVYLNFAYLKVLSIRLFVYCSCLLQILNAVTTGYVVSESSPSVQLVPVRVFVAIKTVCPKVHPSGRRWIGYFELHTYNYESLAASCAQEYE